MDALLRMSFLIGNFDRQSINIFMWKNHHTIYNFFIGVYGNRWVILC